MLIISGFDGTSSAGVILDSHIAKLFQVRHFCILPALTMQNHQENYGTQLLNLKQQLNCIDFTPSFAKIGLLYSAQNIEIISHFLEKFPNIKIICDTPIISSSKKNLVQNIDEYIKIFKEALLPKVYLLTPNLEEMQFFGSVQEILHTGCKNVLLKGGHSDGQFASDILYSHNLQKEFSLPMIDLQGKNVRGTGCGLSTAIACYLHKGFPLENAIFEAKKINSQCNFTRK